MITVIESLLPVFAIIFLGLYIRRAGYVPEDQWEGMQKLSYRVFFPSLFCVTLIKADLSSIPVGSIALTTLMAFLIMSAIIIGLFPVFRKSMGLSDPSNTSMYQGTVRWNAFIALAIVAKLYGTEGIAIIAVTLAILAPLVNVASILILAIYAGSNRPSPRSILLEIGSNPLILASFVGGAINLLHIPIPDPLLTTFDILSRPALPLGLLMVGAGLRLRYAFPPSAAVWTATSLRLVGMPILIFAFGTWFGLEGVALQTALIGGAVPTAMVGYVIAKELGGDAPLYAAIATIQTFASALVLPLVVWLASSL